MSEKTAVVPEAAAKATLWAMGYGVSLIITVALAVGALLTFLLGRPELAKKFGMYAVVFGVLAAILMWVVAQKAKKLAYMSYYMNM
jgi:high-affinity Fe2+/Pb2+ permease